MLEPLEWVGILVQTREEREAEHVHHVFKTPLWRSAMKLDTDDMLRPVSIQQVDFRYRPEPSDNLLR